MTTYCTRTLEEEEKIQEPMVELPCGHTYVLHISIGAQSQTLPYHDSLCIFDVSSD